MSPVSQMNRVDAEFYPTPRWATAALLEQVKFTKPTMKRRSAKARCDKCGMKLDKRGVHAHQSGSYCRFRQEFNSLVAQGLAQAGSAGVARMITRWTGVKAIHATGAWYRGFGGLFPRRRAQIQNRAWFPKNLVRIASNNSLTIEQRQRRLQRASQAWRP